ncbi:hypothetical protein QCO44_06925 [Selenomonas sputigena]|uniref:DUF306 domain-containing protein n=1 Tax=Selenomonas sputigena TaxID=69823 RepID=A0ABV3X6E7_9FIRM
MKGLAMFALCAFVLLALGQSAAAEPRDALDVILERMAGTWYDGDGGAALTIGERTINGCEVVGWGQWVGGIESGGAEFRVKEAGGERTLHIGWKLFGGAGDYITLAGGDALQRTLTPDYFESVGGIHFGMRMSAVQEILGEGKELRREEPCHVGDMSFSQGLYYPDKRLIIFRENGIVTGLVLLRGSKLHFDRSGLGVNDSREAYARAYRLPQIPEESSRSMTAVYSIAPGENLSFGLDGSYVVLSIYEN